MTNTELKQLGIVECFNSTNFQIVLIAPDGQTAFITSDGLVAVAIQAIKRAKNELLEERKGAYNE